MAAPSGRVASWTDEIETWLLSWQLDMSRNFDVRTPEGEELGRLDALEFGADPRWPRHLIVGRAERGDELAVPLSSVRSVSLAERTIVAAVETPAPERGRRAWGAMHQAALSFLLTVAAVIAVYWLLS